MATILDSQNLEIAAKGSLKKWYLAVGISGARNLPEERFCNILSLFLAVIERGQGGVETAVNWEFLFL